MFQGAIEANAVPMAVQTSDSAGDSVDMKIEKEKPAFALAGEWRWGGGETNLVHTAEMELVPLGVGARGPCDGGRGDRFLRPRALAALFADATVVEHVGGHMLPSGSAVRPAVAAFVEEVRKATCGAG